VNDRSHESSSEQTHGAGPLSARGARGGAGGASPGLGGARVLCSGKVSACHAARTRLARPRAAGDLPRPGAGRSPRARKRRGAARGRRRERRRAGQRGAGRRTAGAGGAAHAGYVAGDPCRPAAMGARASATARWCRSGPGEQHGLGFFRQHVPAWAVEGGCERLLLQRTEKALDRGPAVLAANACIAAEFAGAGRASHGIEKLFR
jgi:hypothetical protein